MASDDRTGRGLDPEEIARYSRHLTLPDVGMEGQLRLRESSVVLIGAGGLGSPLALYLAAAGVGRIGVVDFDRVDLSNLQRQVLYTTEDIGGAKSSLAAARIRGVNPHVQVSVHDERLSRDNARALLEPYDIVIDGTDNFPTRYLVNDACVMLGKPNVYGSIFRFEGQVSIFWAERGPCYRCLYPEPPEPGSVPNCAEGGVLGVLPGIIGTLQATEAIKLILGKGDALIGRLLLFDALEMRFRELRLRRDPQCRVRSPEVVLDDLPEYEAACSVGAGSAELPEVDVVELSRRLSQDPPAPLLLDVRTPQEWQICRLEGAQLIPLPELERRMSELDGSREIVVYCHHGIRSAAAVELLRRSGFAGAVNLRGGIDAWSARVDPSLPRY